MSDTEPPATIDECARIAHNLVLTTTGDPEIADIIQRGVEDAYRIGWNRALEGGAQGIEAVDEVEWALAGMHAGADAARLLRSHKKPEGPSDV